MLHIPKIHDHFMVWTDNEVTGFAVKNFVENFKSTKEQLCYKLCDK